MPSVPLGTRVQMNTADWRTSSSVEQCASGLFWSGSVPCNNIGGGVGWKSSEASGSSLGNKGGFYPSEITKGEKPVAEEV